MFKPLVTLRLRPAVVLTSAIFIVARLYIVIGVNMTDEAFSNWADV